MRGEEESEGEGEGEDDGADDELGEEQGAEGRGGMDGQHETPEESGDELDAEDDAKEYGDEPGVIARGEEEGAGGAEMKENGNDGGDEVKGIDMRGVVEVPGVGAKQDNELADGEAEEKAAKEVGGKVEPKSSAGFRGAARGGAPARSGGVVRCPCRHAPQSR